MFLIVALFQSSNNRALLLAAEVLFPELAAAPRLASVGLVLCNAVIILFFLFSGSIYKVIERTMLALVATMLVCFGINAVTGGVQLSGAIGGLIPTQESVRSIGGSITGDLRALIGTTFSVAGAYYQAYLVRERGWKANEYKIRWLDPVVGIATLGLLTLLIMDTAAASLHQKIDANEIKDLRSLAASLQPTFGYAATYVFAGGILAGAISSFVGNAMVGGAVLSDCLGFGSKATERGPRCGTIAALLVGLAIALWSLLSGMQSVAFIVVAQGLTTLGLPLMACVIFYLLRQSAPERKGLAMLVFAGVLVSFYVGITTLMSLLS